MGIAAVGAGVLNVLTLEGEVLSTGVLLLTTSVAAAVLVTIGLIELTLRRDPDEPTDLRVGFSLKLGAGLLALALGLGDGVLGPVALLVALILLVMVQISYGARTCGSDHRCREVVRWSRRARSPSKSRV